MILTGLSHFHDVEKLDHILRRESPMCLQDICVTLWNILYASLVSHYPKGLTIQSHQNRTSRLQSQADSLLRDQSLSLHLTLVPQLTFLITYRSLEMT